MKTSKTSETCKTCKAFLNVSSDNEMGECRRHSPSIGGWPKVPDHSWCLEYVSEKWIPYKVYM